MMSLPVEDPLGCWIRQWQQQLLPRLGHVEFTCGRSRGLLDPAVATAKATAALAELDLNKQADRVEWTRIHKAKFL